MSRFITEINPLQNMDEESNAEGKVKFIYEKTNQAELVGKDYLASSFNHPTISVDNANEFIKYVGDNTLKDDRMDRKQVERELGDDHNKTRITLNHLLQIPVNLSNRNLIRNSLSKKLNITDPEKSLTFENKAAK
jgi:hypothetical protein